MSQMQKEQLQPAEDMRRAIAARGARDIPEGWAVNLGIGLPLQVAGLIDRDKEVMFHSENGILGMGERPAPENVDPWMTNAGKQPITLVKGAALFHHADSFGMIRGGHIDLCILGAYQVAENGDVANWTLSANDRMPAVGGAMDLAVGARNVWVMTEHVSKRGAPKLVSNCTLPLTAQGVVRRIYTDLAVLDVTPDGFRLRDLMPGVSLDQLRAQTGAEVLA